MHRSMSCGSSSSGILSPQPDRPVNWHRSCAACRAAHFTVADKAGMPCWQSASRWPAELPNGFGGLPLCVDPHQPNQPVSVTCISATKHRPDAEYPQHPIASYTVLQALPARPRALRHARHPRPSRRRSVPPELRRRPPLRPGPRRRLQTDTTLHQPQKRWGHQLLTGGRSPHPDEISRQGVTACVTPAAPAAMQPLQCAGPHENFAGAI